MAPAAWLKENYGTTESSEEIYTLRDASANGKAMVGYNIYGNAVIVSL